MVMVSLYLSLSPAESLSVASSPGGEVTLQVGSPLILTCEVLGLPSEVNSGLLVQWMKRGSVSSDAAGTGGVEVLNLTLLNYLDHSALLFADYSSMCVFVHLGQCRGVGVQFCSCTV